MPNPSLHENGEPCPACELRREEANREICGAANVPCNNCGGTGRVAWSAQKNTNRSAKWARENYWPERERRWAIQNAGC